MLAVEGMGIGPIVQFEVDAAPTGREQFRGLGQSLPMDRILLDDLGMRTHHAIAALAGDALDLASLLWLAADAAAKRGDSDAQRVLRLAARQAEAIASALEDEEEGTQLGA